jgi:3-hydroxyacyl-CoA dehydrogenase
VLDVKQALFSELDRLSAPHVILASSTSGFMASEFAAHLGGRHRVLVVHPVNPPHLVPLVEISPAKWTDPDITQTAHQIMSAVKQTPITVQKEIPGFVLNRLQGALLNEALRLVQGGYVTPQDVDKTMRDGLGLRWSFMGPFETIDLNAPAGLADYAQRYGKMYHVMAASQSTAPDWDKSSVAGIDATRRKVLKRDDIGQRQNWRDNRLAALVAHKSKQEN